MDTTSATLTAKTTSFGLDRSAAPLLISRLPEDFGDQRGLEALQTWQTQMVEWLALGQRFVLVQFAASESSRDPQIAACQARWYKAHREALFGLCDGLIVVCSEAQHVDATQKFLQALPIPTALVGSELEARGQAQAWLARA